MAGYDFTTYDIDDDDDDQPCRSGCCRRRRSMSPVSPRTVPISPVKSNTCTSNIQLVLLMMALVGGVGLGILLRTVPPFNEPEVNPRALWYLNFPAEIIVRFMTFLATPLLVSSLLSGISSLRAAGNIGAKAVTFYLLTTLMACLEGFGYVFLICPKATGLDLKKVISNKTTNKIDLLLDMFRNMAPDNVLEAATTSTFTKSSWEPLHSDLTNDTFLETLSLGKKDSYNFLGLTVLSFIFAVTMRTIPKRSKPLIDFFDAVFEVIMAIVNAVLWVLPLGILSMIAVAIIKMKDPVKYANTMLWFLVTVTAGLGTHFFLVMPFVLLILARKNPFKHFAYMSRALVTALSTSNSVVTLPVTMDCLRTKAGYDSRVVRFLCFAGATVNMDGTCLYEAVAVIFVAMLRGVALGPVEVITIGAVAIVLSIGAPAAGGGMMVMVILFESAGLPTEDIAFLLPFDWILGRLRTTVNVWGDSIAVAVVSRFSQDQLISESLDVSEVSSVSDDVSIGMVMNGSYRPCESTPSRRKSYTLTVQNESGDVVKVSKV